MGQGKRWSRIDWVGPRSGNDTANAKQFSSPVPFSGGLKSGCPIQSGCRFYGMPRQVDLAALEQLFVEAALRIA